MDFFSELEPGNWISLICSGISILISISVGLWNFHNTRRQFLAAFYPHIQTSMEVDDCDSGTCVTILMKNLSKDKAILNTQLTLELLNPFRRFLAFKPKWVLLLEEKNIDIQPNEQYKTIKQSNKEFKSLEQFMLYRFPGYIRGEKVGESKFDYFLSHAKHLKFCATINYKASFSGSKPRVIREYFFLKPHCVNLPADKKRLIYWIKE